MLSHDGFSLAGYDPAFAAANPDPLNVLSIDLRIAKLAQEQMQQSHIHSPISTWREKKWSA
jgi:hypothetical protein